MPSTPQPAPGPQSNQTGLPDCYLTTTHILNLRESPNGNIIGLVSYNVRLRGQVFDSGWYNVSVDGLVDCLSADFVTTRGNCA